MTGRKKEAGNVGEILTIGLCILALTALMISYMENVQLIAKKAEATEVNRVNSVYGSQTAVTVVCIRSLSCNILLFCV